MKTKTLSDYIHTPTKSIRYAVRRRGAGYEAQFNLGGKRFREQLAAANATQALLQARGALLRAMERQAAVHVPAGSAPLGATIARYLEEHWPGAPKNHRTLQDYRSRLSIFKAAVGGDVDLAAMPYDPAVGMVQKFIAARKQKGDGNRNLMHFRTILKQFFGWLRRTRDARSGEPLVPWRYNPANVEDIAIDSPGDRLLPALSDAELKLFLEAAKRPVVWGAAQGQFRKGERAARNIWRSVLLCYGAGARPKEATRVKWGEVDFQAGTLLLHGKKRPREIKMSAWLVGELAALPGPKGHDDKVVGASRARTGKQLQKLKRIEKLPDHFDLQALRRTAAKRAAPAMTVHQYSLYFGHGIDLAIKHYIGWGLLGQVEGANVLGMGELKTATESATKRVRCGA